MFQTPYFTGFFGNFTDSNFSEIGHHPFTKLTEIFK